MMTKLNYTLSIAFIAAVGMTAGMAHAGRAPADNEIRVGTALSLSGVVASYGHDILNGMQIALEEINKTGIGGRQVKLLVEDTKSEATDTISGFRKLIDLDHVQVLIGSDTSSNTMAAAPVAQNAKIPLVAPAATAKQVTDVGDFVSKVCFSDDFQGQVMAEYAYQKMGKRRAAIIYEASSDYSTEIAKIFSRRFKELGGEIAEKQFAYTSRDIDFKSTLLKIRRAKPDIVFLPGYYGEVAAILKQANQIGIDVPFVGGDGWDSPNLQQLMGASKLDAYISSHYASDDTDPKVQAFVRSFKTRFHKVPGTMSALGYDALMLVADAIKRSNSLTPQDIKKAINSTQRYSGVSGIISIDAHGNTTKTATVMHVTNEGNKFVERITPAALR